MNVVVLRGVYTEEGVPSLLDEIVCCWSGGGGMAWGSMCECVGGETEPL